MSSGAVGDADDALPRRAAGAAVDAVPRFDAVADHLAPAVRANGRERVDRALEAVEDVRRSVLVHLECLVVVVSANLAGCHLSHLLRLAYPNAACASRSRRGALRRTTRRAARRSRTPVPRRRSPPAGADTRPR